MKKKYKLTKGKQECHEYKYGAYLQRYPCVHKPKQECKCTPSVNPKEIRLVLLNPDCPIHYQPKGESVDWEKEFSEKFASKLYRAESGMPYMTGHSLTNKCWVTCGQEVKSFIQELLDRERENDTERALHEMYISRKAGEKLERQRIKEIIRGLKYKTKKHKNYIDFVENKTGDAGTTISMHGFNSALDELEERIK